MFILLNASSDTFFSIFLFIKLKIQTQMKTYKIAHFHEKF